MTDTDSVSIREYTEALFDRDRAAREIADEEREKAAQALADEREKVAQALAVSLTERISSGDAGLSNHINQEIMRVNAALRSAELLEVERIAAVLQELRSHVALAEALRGSDKDATEKAFAAATELSRSHNDLLRKMEKLSETFATVLYVRDLFDTAEKLRAGQRADDEKAADWRFKRIEDFQARITGGLIVMGTIGIINLVQTLVTGFG